MLSDVSAKFIVAGKSFDWAHLSGLADLPRYIQTALKGAAPRKDPSSYLNGGVRQLLEFANSRSLAISAQLVTDFRACIESGPQGANTKYDLFSVARSYVGALHRAGVVPSFRLPKNLPRDAPVHKANLYELSPVEHSALTECQIEKVRALNPFNELDDIGRCAVVIAEERIEAVARHARKEIQMIAERFQLAETAISEIQIDSVEAFAGMSASLDQALAWAHKRYGRLLPATNKIDPTLYRSIKLRFGGLPTFQSYLAPTADTLAPFIALFLADPLCQPNADDIRCYTFRDCITAGSSSATVTIRFGKLRGSAQEFGVEMPWGARDKWGLAHALTFLNGYTGACQSLSGSNGTTRLTHGRQQLFRHVDRIATKSLRPLDAGTATDCLRRFLARAAASEPSLEAIAKTANGENFRPTHALITVSKKGIFQAQRRLRHRYISTTQSYTDRIHTRSSRAIRIVSYQEFLYQSAASSGPDAHAAASATGLGLHCSAESSDKTPEATHAQCSRPDLCDDGCASAKLVLEDPETVCTWMRMIEYLSAQQGRMQSEYPERWEDRWAPRLAWYTALLAKTSARVKKSAKEVCSKTIWTPPPLT